MENQSNQNSSNTNNLLQENLPSWTSFPLKKFKHSVNVNLSAGVIMDHYLVVLTFDDDNSSDSKINNVLVAFDLHDLRVQEAKIEAGSLEKENFHLIKYDEKQIIKYDGNSAGNLVLMTIESFQPLKVKCEEIKNPKQKRFQKQTAQIFQDCLYIYAELKDKFVKKKKNASERYELWSFDLKSKAWKLCQTTGKAPSENLRWGKTDSFIFQDNFCIYGVNSKNLGDLFMLNLDSMRWTKTEQQEKYLENYDSTNRYLRNGGTVYEDHLVVLKYRLSAQKNTLCFINLHTKNTWSTFAIQGMKENLSSYMERRSDNFALNLMIFKNLVLSLAYFGNDLVVFVMSLDSFGISAPKSAEEERLNSLFLSQTESDISFKVQDKLIPAHKQVLINKSRYFANVFNSRMMESRQDIIDIQDCEYDVFKEYLQYIYQETINLEDIDRTIKLYTLADKYLQENLRQKCLYSINHGINKENASKIFDFAVQQNISQIQNWVIEFLKHHAKFNNVIGLIESLGRQEDSELKENTQRVRGIILIFVLNHFFDPDENDKGSMQAYEEFICGNIELYTISALAHFLNCSKSLPENEQSIPQDLNKHSQKENENSMIFFNSQDFLRFLKRTTTPKTRNIFEKRTTRLRETAFSFVHANIETVLSKDLPSGFLVDFNLDSAEKTSKQIQDLTMKLNPVEISKDRQENNKENEKNRIEPIQYPVDAENPMQAQNSSNKDNSSQDKVPSWIQFHLKTDEYRSSFTYSEGFIVDHYLGIFVKKETTDMRGTEKACETKSLLTFNLQDHTVKEAFFEFRSFEILEGSHFLQYNGNQLIQYGSSNLACLTIESVEPLKVKCEDIKTPSDQPFTKNTAQIYKDCLYIYGRVGSCYDSRTEIWSFDLKNRVWRLCETTGKMPDSMTWTKIKHYAKSLKASKSIQGERNRNDCDLRFGDTVYKDHFVVFANSLFSTENIILFLDLHTKNTFSAFEIKGLEGPRNDYYPDEYIPHTVTVGNMMIYQNLILSFVHFNKKLLVIAMNFDSFEISARKSIEEEHISSLFLNEAESDIILKIEDQLIPAHKRVLMTKSQYFEKILNSGQDVIDTKDCEYNVFKEYLQFIYQGRVNFNSANQAIKLYALAHHYLQRDLIEKCINYLSHNINETNLFKILDFALQENIVCLYSWCLKFLKDNINIYNVAKIIKYLERQEDPQVRKRIWRCRDVAFRFVLCYFFEIEMNEKEDMQVCQSFLIRNVEINTISVLTHFLNLSEKYSSSSKLEDLFIRFRNYEGSQIPLPDSQLQFKFILKDSDQSAIPKTADLFSGRTKKLAQAACLFIKENLKASIPKIGRSGVFPNAFLKIFTRYSVLASSKEIQDLTMKINQVETSQEMSKGARKENEKKRMEPVQDGTDEENPTLKKTKK